MSNSIATQGFGPSGSIAQIIWGGFNPVATPPTSSTIKYFDRVKELSSTVGTGNITLAGAVPQFQSFASVFNVGDSFYYGIADRSGLNWETGIGTLLTSTTFSRSVLESSNSDALVNFSSGSLFVWNDFPAVACDLAQIKQAPVVTSLIGGDTVVLLRNNVIYQISPTHFPSGGGGFIANQREITGGSVDTASTTDGYIGWNSNTGLPKTQIIPASTGSKQVLIIDDILGDSSSDAITIMAADSGTISGYPSIDIATNNGSLMLLDTLYGWRLIG